MARKIAVELVGDERDLLRAFSRSASAAKKFNSDVGKIGRGAVAGSGAFGGLGRSIAFASGAFLGGAGLVSAFRAAFGEMADAQKATAQTNAVLASTAGIANVTAGHVDELATSLLNLSGVDDEVIKSGENLLLTFTNVRNQIGEGNDIFDQATKAALDMSVAMKTDLSSAALRVGKALQDPVRGITALRRVGVAFTDAQQKQIKTLVASGRALEAQRIILRELTTEFGGSAEAAGNTLPGKLNILKETVRNLAGTIATLLLPSITRIVDRLVAWFQNTQNQQRVTETFRNIIQQLGEAARVAANLITGLVDALGGWKAALTLAIGAWAGFKVAGVTASTAVLIANVAAARGVAAAWRAALIATGWGALAVAAGIAAAEVIAHWETVKRWFASFWLWLQETADKTALAIIEPLSHIPEILGIHIGSQARQIKEALKADIAELERMAAVAAAVTGQKPGAAAPSAAPPAVPGSTKPFAFSGTKGKAAAAKTAKGFTLPFRFQLEQAAAEASGVQAQIVKAAHDVAVFVASVIPKLRGQKLLDALSLFAQANGTVAAANQDAAQKAQAIAEKAKQDAKRASQKAAQQAKQLAEALRQFAVPLVLQVAQARAEALGKTLRPILVAIRKAAQKALKSGRLGLQGQLDAWNTIAQINQQLAEGAVKAKRAVEPFGRRGIGHAFGGLPEFATSGLTSTGLPAGTTIHIEHFHSSAPNVAQLENELVKRSKSRPHPRRGP